MLCQSVYARGGIHVTHSTSLRVSSPQNLTYGVRKRYVVSCVTGTQQLDYCLTFASYQRWPVTSNLAQGQAAVRVPGKLPCMLPAEGARGPPERSSTGRPVCLTK
jgi:hypothetical protein